jgi:mannose-6-phosphate isomerase-like protein (cupin superfamily)
MRGKVATWRETEAELVLPGISRQVIWGENQSPVRYLHHPGSALPVHTHPEEQVMIVTSGSNAFTVAGERLELGPGAVAVIPCNTEQSAEAFGVEIVETFNIMSPRRRQSPSFAEEGAA